MQMRHIYTKYSTLPHHINCSTKRPHVGKTWGNSWGNVFERMRTPKCRRTFPCPNSFTTNPTRRPSSFSYQSLALVHWSRPPMRTPHARTRMRVWRPYSRRNPAIGASSLCSPPPSRTDALHRSFRVTYAKKASFRCIRTKQPNGFCIKRGRLQ